VRALIFGGGADFWDGFSASQNDPVYQVPKAFGTNAIFTSSLWVGGIDQSGGLRIAAERYRKGGVDYYPGPLFPDGTTSDSLCWEFDQVYSLTDSEVFDHVAGVFTSQEVLRWPAKGNPYIDAPMQDLAPFVDVDGDGIYDATKGDYPDIKGNQAIWHVFNDAGGPHDESGGDPIGVEVQVLAYAYQVPGFYADEPVKTTTFYDYRIINKGFALSDVRVGLNIDSDLGNAFDDYVGCDSTRNMGIQYNGDAFDEDDQGRPGYGNNLPQIGIQVLDEMRCSNGTSSPMTSFMYLNNSPNGPNGDPQLPIDYYNYMKGTWRDGTPLYYGGTGYVTSAWTPLRQARFMFPSDPGITSADFWTEGSEGNTPFDRRFIMGFGPFDLDVGETIEFTQANVFSQLSPLPGFGGLKENSDVVEAFHDSLDGCTNFDPQYQIQVTDPTSGNSDGSINVTFVGDVPQILWSTSETTSSITDLAAGTYTLAMSDGFNCYEVEKISVGVTSIEDINGNAAQMILFPNPAQDVLQVRHNLKGKVQVEIYDLAGHLIEMGLVNESVEQISLSQMSPGTYFLQLKNDKEVLRSSFIKTE
jgi:hypothetical protein